jgi:hypothetical protein
MTAEPDPINDVIDSMSDVITSMSDAIYSGAHSHASTNTCVIISCYPRLMQHLGL